MFKPFRKNSNKEGSYEAGDSRRSSRRDSKKGNLKDDSLFNTFDRDKYFQEYGEPLKFEDERKDSFRGGSFVGELGEKDKLFLEEDEDNEDDFFDGQRNDSSFGNFEFNGDPSVIGYEHVTFEPVLCIPTLDDEFTSSEKSTLKSLNSSSEDGSENETKLKGEDLPYLDLTTGPILDQETAKCALLDHIKEKHCCYGTTPAKQLDVKRLEYVPAFHYELQSFVEKREVAWTYSPLKNHNSSSGQTPYFQSSRTNSLADCAPRRVGVDPPLPWDIEENPTQSFKDEVRLVAVPNTMSLKHCHRCRGTGGVQCRQCSGKGWIRCVHCHGDGYMSGGGGGGNLNEGGSYGARERCFYCNHSKFGQGHQDCGKCSSRGKVSCMTCEGIGQVRCYIQLSITWKVQTDEYIVETDKELLPHKLIRDASGQVAFEEEQPDHVSPIKKVSEPRIATESSKLISKHKHFHSDQRILRQRHQIRVVPVTRVIFDWKKREFEFCVYGYENKVQLSKYPQKCCWGCTIL